MIRSWLAAETGGPVLCGGEPGIGKTRPVLARVLGPEPAGAPSVTGMEVLREYVPVS
jgi:MoxR-like ATPase